MRLVRRLRSVALSIILLQSSLIPSKADVTNQQVGGKNNLKSPKPTTHINPIVFAHFTGKLFGNYAHFTYGLARLQNLPAGAETDRAAQLAALRSLGVMSAIDAVNRNPKYASSSLPHLAMIYGVGINRFRSDILSDADFTGFLRGLLGAGAFLTDAQAIQQTQLAPAEIRALGAFLLFVGSALSQQMWLNFIKPSVRSPKAQQDIIVANQAAAADAKREGMSTESYKVDTDQNNQKCNEPPDPPHYCYRYDAYIPGSSNEVYCVDTGLKAGQSHYNIFERHNVGGGRCEWNESRRFHAICSFKNIPKPAADCLSFPSHCSR